MAQMYYQVNNYNLIISYVWVTDWDDSYPHKSFYVLLIEHGPGQFSLDLINLDYNSFLISGHFFLIEVSMAKLDGLHYAKMSL